MMLGAHLISSGGKLQSEADAVSINRLPNVIVSLRFGTSDGVFADLLGGTSLIGHIHKKVLHNGRMEGLEQE